MADFDEKRMDAQRVADLTLKILGAKSPKRRYSVGYMAHAAAFLEVLPQPVADRILKMRFQA